MSECRKRVTRRGSGLAWAALGRAVSVSIVLAAPWTMARATPPTVVLVWIDRAGLEAAAAPFGVEAQRSFDGALRGVTAPGLCGGSASAHGFECVQPSGLLRALPPLICPAVQGGRADQVETFFAELRGPAARPRIRQPDGGHGGGLPPRPHRRSVGPRRDPPIPLAPLGRADAHDSHAPGVPARTEGARAGGDLHRAGFCGHWPGASGAGNPPLAPAVIAPPSRTLRRPGSAPAPARRA